MKQRKLIKALLGISFLTLGMVTVNDVKEVKEVNAEVTSPYSYTFSEKQFTANGTKALGGVNWTLSNDGNYYGYDGTKGQQIGSGGNPIKTMTLSTSEIEGTITEVKINTSGASSTNAKLSLNVGGVQAGSQVSLTSSAKEYTFEPNTSGEIVFTWTQTSKKAVYFKSISITFEAGSSTPAIPKYSVSFDTNGGDEIVNQEIYENQFVTKPTDPTRDGYDFMGWYTDETCTTPWDFETMAITADTTIYAKWQAEDPNQPKWTLVTDEADLTIGGKYIITDKDSSFAMADQNTNNRRQAILNKKPVGGVLKDKYLPETAQEFLLKAGNNDGTYAFYDETGDDTGYLYAAGSDKNYLKTQQTIDVNSSWTISISDTGVASIVAKGSNNRNVMQYNSTSTLFACYASATQTALSLYKYYDPSAAYTVTFVNYEGGTEVESQSVADGGKVNQPAALTRDGYTFGGWYTDASYSTAWDFANDTVSGNITLYAKWNNDACEYVDLVESYMELAYKYTVTNEDLPTYRKVTSVEDVVDGSSVIIVSVDAEGNRYALSNRNEKSGSGKLDPVAVVANEDVIEDYSSRITWSVAADSTNGFTLANGENYLKTDSEETNLETATAGSAFTVGSDENGNFYFVGERPNSIPMYVQAADGNYFKDYNVVNFGKEINGSTYASSVEIYVADEENIVAKDVYSGAEFRIKFGIAKEDMNAVMEDVPTGAVFGLEVSTADKVQKFTEFRTDDETCHYVVVSLGDVINEIENAAVEFTVKAYIEFEGITYYTTDAELVKTYSVASMVEAYYTNGDTRVESLYNYFESKDLYA